jgi:hypothetical protein
MPANPAPPRPPVNGNGSLSGSQERILAAIAQWEALGRNWIAKPTLAALARVSSTSSGYANNLGALRSRGYIEYPGPGTIAFTEEGRAIAPAADAPRSPGEMLGQCQSLVSVAQSRILASLADSYPKALPKSDLAERAAASATSSGFANNLGALRTAGMIDYPAPGHVKLEPWVMLDEA